jgi:hypothetical protein
MAERSWDEARADLLGDRATGDPEADVIAAMNEALDRRERNTDNGAAAIKKAQVELGWTLREIERRVPRMKRSTAHRWASPPPEETP